MTTRLGQLTRRERRPRTRSCRTRARQVPCPGGPSAATGFTTPIGREGAPAFSVLPWTMAAPPRAPRMAPSVPQLFPLCRKASGVGADHGRRLSSRRPFIGTESPPHRSAARRADACAPCPGARRCAGFRLTGFRHAHASRAAGLTPVIEPYRRTPRLRIWAEKSWRCLIADKSHRPAGAVLALVFTG
jgi:hypothetical protein